MAPADDANSATAAAEPTVSTPSAPIEETSASLAPTRGPSARKAKTAAAKKEAPASDVSPKAKKPRTKKAPATKSSSESGPSYFDLIVEAIKELKERNGSSRQAIGKVVENKKNNYASHHLNKVLRTAAEAGKLIQIKGSYKLSPELRKPAASKKKSLKVSESSAKTVKRVGNASMKAPKSNKTAAKKVAASKKVAAKKAPAKKMTAKKTTATKAPSKKVSTEKAAGKKATAKTTKKTVKKTAKK
ncbi:unnamed protein product [Peronospora effusa]|uniref:H15 domain-containing protein n=1 Tax=Peronospora effusa TaxID=542832 RepID=A0A3M6VDB6_9STRA|nr:hypothetical protein DD238_008107 [Peronospora effusa]RQM12988.1 hypothetical protein DD237_007958 [Peronospora effusa]CAI5703443.1 unnamed protein product [Peronospora effusa]